MSQNNIYVVADTHLGHSKASHFRPFVNVDEHDNHVITNWNSIVKNKDTVWLLGDVFFGGRDNHLILEKLNGYKHLVLGNHDQYPLEIYQKYFHKIVGAYQYNGCILTHLPIHPSQFYRYRLNIHGHTHSNKLEDERYVCVSLEQIDYKPVLLNKLIHERCSLIMNK
jgi:calcineurin-like phosphoesterase family protein